MNIVVISTSFIHVITLATRFLIYNIIIYWYFESSWDEASIFSLLMHIHFYKILHFLNQCVSLWISRLDLSTFSIQQSYFFLCLHRSILNITYSNVRWFLFPIIFFMSKLNLWFQYLACGIFNSRAILKFSLVLFITDAIPWLLKQFTNNFQYYRFRFRLFGLSKVWLVSIYITIWHYWRWYTVQRD